MSQAVGPSVCVSIDILCDSLYVYVSSCLSIYLSTCVSVSICLKLSVHRYLQIIDHPPITALIQHIS